MNYVRTAVLLAALTALLMGIGYLLGGRGGALIAFFVAAATNFFAYWNGDRLVLSMHGAQEVDEHTDPELVHIVADLADLAGLPMPRVYLMDNPQPNAFATGRNPQHAAVAATTGLLELLGFEQLITRRGCRSARRLRRRYCRDEQQEQRDQRLLHDAQDHSRLLFWP